MRLQVHGEPGHARTDGPLKLILFAALLVHVNWCDELQRVILLATFLVQRTIGLAVIALGADIRWWALRIERAIQLGPENGTPVGR